MRDNTHINLVTNDIEKIQIENLPPFDIGDYDLNDEKEMRKYLFDIERTCRNSYAYKKFIGFLREHVDMNKCSFYENVNNVESYSIKIHIHHAPLTLFDIVEIVVRKRTAKKESLNVNLVAKEIMLLHYLMLVGLIPLSETVHELVHNGYLFIPTDHVFGRYREFIDSYKEYIDSQLMKTLESAEEYTKTYDFMKETEVLKMKMVYIDPSGSYEFPVFKEIVEKIKENIDQQNNTPS